MIEKIELIPTTAESHPFAQASVRCDFEKNGYQEEEYFLTGKANVYQEDDQGLPQVLYADAPYVNRMIVRRPIDLAKFSGNVVVEILNPSARMDIDRMWVFSWRYFIEHGDIYIGITSKPDVLQALYTFDPERYTRIKWDNPLPGRPLPLNKSPFPVLPEHETGLFWDMLTDLARLLRTPGSMNPIAQYGKSWLFLTGWSQSGSFLVRYQGTFAKHLDDLNGRPIYDGYLEAGAGPVPCPINSFEPSSPFFDKPQGIQGRVRSKEPYIALNTESENEMLLWDGDATKPGQLFRIYDIPGSSHDSKYNLLDYYNGDVDTVKTGTKPEFYGLEPYPIDYPYEFVFNAAFRNLYVWVREGVPAPASRQIAVGPDGKNPKDFLGNTIGGVRTPFIDLPTCVYSKYCTLKTNPTVIRDFFGHIEPFSAEKLRALYGDLDHYRELVARRTDEVIAEGYLLASDREPIIQTAITFARERGLCERSRYL